MVLAPAVYWARILKTVLNEALDWELSNGQRMECVSTDVVISVTERMEGDVKIQSERTNTNWLAIEKVFLGCLEYFEAGKKFHVELSINYKADLAAPANRSSKKGEREVIRPPPRGCSGTSMHRPKRFKK